jgi:hypothetical protein
MLQDFLGLLVDSGSRVVFRDKTILPRWTSASAPSSPPDLDASSNAQVLWRVQHRASLLAMHVLHLSSRAIPIISVSTRPLATVVARESCHELHAQPEHVLSAQRLGRRTAPKFSIVQKRKMSSPADHRPLEKPPKMPPMPVPSASVLVISPTNQVLLLHRVRTASAFSSGMCSFHMLVKMRNPRYIESIATHTIRSQPHSFLKRRSRLTP